MVSKSVQSLLYVAMQLHKNAGEPAVALEGLLEGAEPVSEAVADLESKVQRFVEALVEAGASPESIEDAFSQVLTTDDPAAPAFEENPDVKGNWGEGDERDILLSSKTINLLKAAHMIMGKNPVEDRTEDKIVSKKQENMLSLAELSKEILKTSK